MNEQQSSNHGCTLVTGGCRIFEKAGGGSNLGLHAKKGVQGGPALDAMVRSLHRGSKGGGGVKTPRPPWIRPCVLHEIMHSTVPPPNIIRQLEVLGGN